MDYWDSLYDAFCFRDGLAISPISRRIHEQYNDLLKKETSKMREQGHYIAQNAFASVAEEIYESVAGAFIRTTDLAKCIQILDATLSDIQPIPVSTQDRVRLICYFDERSMPRLCFEWIEELFRAEPNSNEGTYVMTLSDTPKMELTSEESEAWRSLTSSIAIRMARHRLQKFAKSNYDVDTGFRYTLLGRAIDRLRLEWG